MLRSLYSGVTGMRNHQTKLDVIGNNIANVNTYGLRKVALLLKMKSAKLLQTLVVHKVIKVEQMPVK